MNTKVLWIDDQWDNSLIELAENEFNLFLSAYKTSRAGMDELEKNIFAYSAVILDAKVFDESENEVAKLVGMQHSIQRLTKLQAKHFIPFCVYTGQPDLVDDATFLEIMAGTRIFKKASETKLMLAYLLEQIEKQPETQIKNDYQKAFEACEFIGEEYQKHLLRILSSIKNPSQVFDDEVYFTQIRIILEGLFRKANKLGFLHNACLPFGKVNLTESANFLSGVPTKHLNVSCGKKHFNKIISDSVDSILSITGAASHTVEADIKTNINLQTYRIKNNTPYLLYSLTFQLMDILIWFKKYAEENNRIDENKSFWIPPEPVAGEWLNGEVTGIIEGKNFAFFKTKSSITGIIIPPNLYSRYSLKNGDKIAVTVEDYKNKNDEIKTRVKDLKII
jgi:hypothetical protein